MRLPEGEARSRFAAAPPAPSGGRTWRWSPSPPTATCAAVGHKPKPGGILKRLRNAGENPAVTMLADHYSEDWETPWWVRADGRAAVLAGQCQAAGPLGPLADRYWQYRQARPAGPVPAVTAGRRAGWTGAQAA